MSDDLKVKNIFNEEEVNFDGALLRSSGELSFVGEEQRSGDFVVTADLAKFDNLIEIIQKVLSAKGFTLNLENMLAMLDQFQFGIRAQVRSDEEGPSKAISYNYCIKLPSPNKKVKGELLQAFYEELKTYQKEIIKLKDEKEKYENKSKTQTVKELRDELKKLQSENASLKEKNKILVEKLEKSLEHGFQNVSEQQSSWVVDNGEVRVVNVSNINYLSNQLELKSAKNSFTYDLSKLYEVPKIGSRCLSFIQEGVVHKVFPLDENSEKFDLVLSEIITANGDGFKVRDFNRNVLIIKHKSTSDKNKGQSLNRGMKVLLYKIQGKIIRWDALQTKNIDYELGFHESHFQYQYAKEGTK